MRVTAVEYELEPGIILSVYKDGITIDIKGQTKHYDVFTFRQIYMFIEKDRLEIRIARGDGVNEPVLSLNINPDAREKLSFFNRCIADFKSRINQFDKSLENKLTELLNSRLISYDHNLVKNLGCVILHDHEHVSNQGHLIIYDEQLMIFISYLNHSKILTPEPKYYGLEYESKMAWDVNTPFPGTILIDYNTAFSVYPEVMEDIRAFYAAHNLHHHLQGPQGAKGTIVDVDLMNEEEFENFIISLLFKMGYRAMSTRMAAEYGVGVIATKDGKSIGIMAQCNIANVSEKEIRGLIDGLCHYGLDQGIAITNMYFTGSAVSLAETSGIGLWNRDVLRDKIYELGI